MAGEEWTRLFMTTHSEQMLIRKPEATSLSQSPSLNKINNDNLFNNFEDVHMIFGPIPRERIRNTDKTVF
jgi:hypothetical protein